ncbi:AMP-binding protein [Pseudomonas qingdaonensis]|nr:AMP-binding protein [Pseudomonas qingdaonensis]
MRPPSSPWASIGCNCCKAWWRTRRVPSVSCRCWSPVPRTSTRRPSLDDTCIHHLIEQAGAATAQGIAAISAGRQITYATLCQRSDALAAALRQAGVQVDERVGVVADRSIDMLVAILAVLKAGAAYLPLEPEQPRERLDFMLADSNVRVVLAASTWAETLPVQVHLMHADAVYPDAAAPVVAVAPDNLAYVIYTSGTTGRPKGVSASAMARWSTTCAGSVDACRYRPSGAWRWSPRLPPTWATPCCSVHCAAARPCTCWTSRRCWMPTLSPATCTSTRWMR